MCVLIIILKLYCQGPISITKWLNTWAVEKLYVTKKKKNDEMTIFFFDGDNKQ